MAGAEETKKRTLWDDISESTVPLKIASLLGVGGATLNRTGAEIMDYVLPPFVPAAAPGARRVQDANFAALEKAWGIGDKANNPTVTMPAAPQAVQKTETAVKPSVEKVAPLSVTERFKDPYEAVSAMDDKDFMHFVDNHGGMLPGVGYVKNGKKIERVIQNPATKKEADYELTNDQLGNALAILQTKAAHAAGVGANNTQAKTDDLKSPMAVLKLAAEIGKRVDPATGEATVDMKAGLGMIPAEIRKAAGLPVEQERDPLADAIAAVRQKPAAKDKIVSRLKTMGYSQEQINNALQ